jgi:hypothetical protein
MCLVKLHNVEGGGEADGGERVGEREYWFFPRTLVDPYH